MAVAIQPVVKEELLNNSVTVADLKDLEKKALNEFIKSPPKEEPTTETQNEVRRNLTVQEVAGSSPLEDGMDCEDILYEEFRESRWQPQSLNQKNAQESADDNAAEEDANAAEEDGIPHLSKVGAFSVDVSLEGSAILCRQIDEAIALADFISLHMPLTPATDKIFNALAFAKKKKGAHIVNVARGGVIKEEALVRALDSGIVAPAALDVFIEEPPAKENKLVQHENVIVKPHLGASTTEAQEGVAVEIAEAVVGALKGELAATVVNAPMVTAEDYFKVNYSHVLSELAPYVVLAKKLGRLAVQLVGGGSGVKLVKVTYASGRVSDDLDTRVLRAMIIKGIIELISSSFVNLVNADFVSRQRGLRLSEERIQLDSSPQEPLESIQVRIANVESKFSNAISESVVFDDVFDSNLIWRRLIRNMQEQSLVKLKSSQGLVAM